MSLERFIIIPDTHGKLLDRDSWKVVRNFLGDYKPSIRIHLGDLFDLKGLRRAADPKDEADDIQEDWQTGLTILDNLKPTHFMAGNHDWRLWNLLDDTRGLVRSFASSLIKDFMSELKAMNCHFFPYDARRGVLTIGRMKVIHGYHCGIGAARLHAQIYGNVIYGHTHAIESAPVPGIMERQARSIGCLCQLDQPYMAAKTGKLRWRHGFGYGTINNKTGRFHFCQAQKLDGIWTLSAAFKDYV